jgi:hypothetical protein
MLRRSEAGGSAPGAAELQRIRGSRIVTLPGVRSAEAAAGVSAYHTCSPPHRLRNPALSYAPQVTIATVRHCRLRERIHCRHPATFGISRVVATPSPRAALIRCTPVRARSPPPHGELQHLRNNRVTNSDASPVYSHSSVARRTARRLTAAHPVRRALDRLCRSERVPG